ncbi:hypothetical protein [Rhizobium sp. MHM7A]|uniref:hypothetical protein n=1 Tax=Rhizobium sp. MHM7A TaxID=2583233 RepID=UPI001106255E|nr:hypothetical protein [Rhizobium sp. MHM7A]TLX15996.1 hypothetical protein FFR93_01375 [Rhizobium sp. MHM7A]
MVRAELIKFLSKSAVQRAVARDFPCELYGETLKTAFRLGLLATAERETPKGAIIVALPNERSELWLKVRARFLEVRRHRNLSVDWLNVGQKAVSVGGRRYKPVWCEGESPTVLKAVATETCDRLEIAS